MAITPKSEDKYDEKCSTAQSFIFPKWHSFKIGTLAEILNSGCSYLITTVIGLSLTLMPIVGSCVSTDLLWGPREFSCISIGKKGEVFYFLLRLYRKNMNRIEKWKDCKNLNYMSAFLGVLASAAVKGCRTKLKPVTKYTHQLIIHFAIHIIKNKFV